MRSVTPPVARPEGSLAVDDLAAAAGRLDALACTGAEGMRMDRQGLAEVPLGEHLHGHILAGGEAVGLHQLDRDLGARVEAALERCDVHRLGVRAKGLEGHRLLHVGAAQLSHAHVDRHLSTLERCAALGARARTGTLLATTRGLPRARAFAAPDSLARAPAAGCRCEAVQADALLRGLLGRAHLASSTSTRWRTACSMPRACSVSSIFTVWPMRRRPSERSVSSCLWLEPFLERRWVTLLSLIHISEPTRLGMISYAVFCLKKKKSTHNN